jgi:hypothetical protein
MEKFLVLYRSKMTMGEQMGATTDEQRQASMDAWMAWGAKAGDALVEWGAPTQPTTEDDPGPSGWIGGYSIVQAEDAGAAQALLADHPHHQVGTIEVLHIHPMPGS